MHKAVQPPVVEDGTVQTSLLMLCLLFLLMGFGDQLPLGKIANHHGAFNQSAGDEMRGFMQTVPLFMALAFRDAPIHLSQVEVSARFLLAAVALGANRVELAVVPAMPREAANGVEAAPHVHAGCQGFDTEIEGE